MNKKDTNLKCNVGIVVHSKYLWLINQWQTIDEVSKFLQLVIYRSIVDPCIMD